MDDPEQNIVDVLDEIADTLLARVARSIAPEVNAALAKLPRKPTPQQKIEYCPGCGEPSSWVPDLCPECLEVNADT